MPEKSEAEEFKETLNKGFLLAAVHLIFLGVLIFYFYAHRESINGEDTMWIYGASSVVSVLFLSIVTILFKDGNFFKNTVSLVCSTVNVFLLPMALYARTGDTEVTFYFAILFQMALIAMSRIEGVILIGFAGCALLYKSEWVFGEGMEPSSKMFMAYLFVFIVALLWRLLVKRLFLAFTALADQQKGAVTGASAEQIKTLQAEKEVLRAELVQHVVEMKEFMSEKNVEEKSRES